MAITKLTDNLDNIASLSDAPALPAQELKKKFDEGSKTIKEYINNTLTVEIDKLVKDIRDSVKNQLLEDNKKKYHIGKIVMSASDVNPSEYLGFGIWKKWGEGKVPVGVDTTQLEFDTPEKEGGEKAHTQTIDELATHDHKIVANSNGGSGTIKVDSGSTYSVPNPIGEIKVGKAGKNKPMNILQPYITCYMYKRIS